MKQNQSTEIEFRTIGGYSYAYEKPTHEELEDARTNARLDAQAEREDQIEHERGDDE